MLMARPRNNRQADRMISLSGASELEIESRLQLYWNKSPEKNKFISYNSQRYNSTQLRKDHNTRHPEAIYHMDDPIFR